MFESSWMDTLGWIGTVGLGMFYWKIGSGKVLEAYFFGIAGASAWFVAGVLSHYGYESQLPSLMATEAVVIGMNIRGIYRWKKGLN